MTKRNDSGAPAAGSAEERTEWVLWSVRNDPGIDAPSGQERIAAHYIRDAIAAVMEERAEDRRVADQALAFAHHERDVLRAALRRLEWLPDADGSLCCLECFGHGTHDHDCALRAALRGERSEPAEGPSDSSSVPAAAAQGDEK